ncbi:MAG: hypothetical protein WA885_03500 [Phormidesmis sp.]
MPPIFFFIPPALWPNDLPTQLDQPWAGYSLGLYAWTVQTHLHLRAAGVACVLTRKLPDEGIVLCHSNALRSLKIPTSPRRLVICIKAESPLSPQSTLHIVQNPLEASPTANRYYIPHWPQPQLIPRDASRGIRFKTLAFLGHEDNLAPELQSTAWQTALAERSLQWRVIASANRWDEYSNGISNGASNGTGAGWNDYHDIDAIVAVRSFNPWQRRLTKGFDYKPATKLYNAWLAGAIPILGVESAYRRTGDRNQDYVEVLSFSELLNALDWLKVDESYRRSLLVQGHIKAQDYTPEKIARKWQVFLEAIAIPAYLDWRSYSPRQRKQAILAAQSASYFDKAKRRSRRWLNQILPS